MTFSAIFFRQKNKKIIPCDEWNEMKWNDE